MREPSGPGALAIQPAHQDKEEDKVPDNGESAKCAKKETRKKAEWTDEETQLLLGLYKTLGSRWSVIAKKFPGRTENDVKNRFYTTLKRVATQAQLEDPVKYNSRFSKCKGNLLQFVDAAIMYGKRLPSKRGRKKNCEKATARTNGFLFPKLETSPPSSVPMSVQERAAPPRIVLPPVQMFCPVQPVFQYAFLPAMPYYQYVRGSCPVLPPDSRVYPVNNQMQVTRYQTGGMNM